MGRTICRPGLRLLRDWSVARNAFATARGTRVMANYGLINLLNEANNHPGKSESPPSDGPQDDCRRRQPAGQRLERRVA